MKAIQILVLLLFMGTTSAQDNKPSKQKKSEETTFLVNMHCQNCQTRIEKNIAWEKGVKNLKVNLEDKTVTIIYNPQKTTEEKLQKAIEKLDFTCEKKK
jgi:copper chaperone CopZ